MGFVPDHRDLRADYGSGGQTRAARAHYARKESFLGSDYPRSGVTPHPDGLMVKSLVGRIAVSGSSPLDELSPRAEFRNSLTRARRR